MATKSENATPSTSSRAKGPHFLPGSQDEASKRLATSSVGTGGGGEKVWVPLIAWGPLIVRGSLAHNSMERAEHHPKEAAEEPGGLPGEEGYRGGAVGSQTSE